jgi:uncharacterized protein YndB with AHSA1/START domain
MSPYDSTEPGQTGTVTFDLDLPHPPGKVWRALTEPDLLAAWLLPVIGLELEPGAAFTFQADPQPGWDGVVDCRLVEIETHRKLSWQWVVGDIDTVVTFTLTPTKSGTHLSLVHAGFGPEQKRNFAGARYGWNMMSGKLVELLTRMQ